MEIHKQLFDRMLRKSLIVNAYISLEKNMLTNNYIDIINAPNSLCPPLLGLNGFKLRWSVRRAERRRRQLAVHNCVIYCLATR